MHVFACIGYGAPEVVDGCDVAAECTICDPVCFLGVDMEVEYQTTHRLTDAVNVSGEPECSAVGTLDLAEHTADVQMDLV